MAKTDFCGSWIVTSKDPQIEDVTVNVSNFVMKDDGGDKVRITYFDFGEGYEPQCGHYRSSSDTIVAEFSAGATITFQFGDNNGTPDFKRVKATVNWPTYETPGEWGAEADSKLPLRRE